MSANTIPITKRGAELLKEELQRLKHIDRPAVINAISEARAQGISLRMLSMMLPKKNKGLLKVESKSSRPSCLVLRLLIQLS